MLNKPPASSLEGPLCQAIPKLNRKFPTFADDQRYHVARRIAMSQYAFHCQDCDKEFTQHHHLADIDKAEIKCPHCGSKNVHQLVSAFSAVTSKKS